MVGDAPQPNSPEPMEEEVDNQEQTQAEARGGETEAEPQLRRSARVVSQGGPKSYAMHNKRQKRTEPGKSKGVFELQGEAELLAALEEEALMAKGLDMEDESKVDKFCGIQGGNEILELGGGSGTAGEEQQLTNTAGMTDQGESVLGALEFSSEDELSEEEAEAGPSN